MAASDVENGNRNHLTYTNTCFTLKFAHSHLDWNLTARKGRDVTFQKTAQKVASPLKIPETVPMARKQAPLKTLNIPATKRFQNVYARSPEEQDAAIAEALAKEDTFPDDAPIKETAGKKFGLMWPRSFATSHPTAPILDECANKGCPVDCGPNWTPEHIEAGILRGNHTSASSKRATEALRED